LELSRRKRGFEERFEESGDAGGVHDKEPGEILAGTKAAALADRELSGGLSAQPVTMSVMNRCTPS
jgi:hypothetical protein